MCADLEARVALLEQRVEALEGARVERWATIFEVAEHLRVSSETVRRWTRDGRLEAHGEPGARRWDLNEVDAAFRG